MINYGRFRESLPSLCAHDIVCLDFLFTIHTDNPKPQNNSIIQMTGIITPTATAMVSMLSPLLSPEKKKMFEFYDQTCLRINKIYHT